MYGHKLKKRNVGWTRAKKTDSRETKKTKLIINKLISFYRYLFELGRKSSEVPDPNKEAVINQWVEWESTSLQVCFYVGGVE